MATTYTFGTTVQGAQYVELPAVQVTAADSSIVRVSPRPTAGLTLMVRNAATLAGLTATTVDGNGYWSYTTTDIPIIQVSADGGTTWVPQYAKEALDGAVRTAVDVATVTGRVAAAETATTSLSTRVSALEAGGTGGTGAGSMHFDTVAAFDAAYAAGTIPVGTIVTVG